MEEVKVDLSYFDFEKKKNNNSITADEINILCGFKYSEYYMESMQLFLKN